MSRLPMTLLLFVFIAGCSASTAPSVPSPLPTAAPTAAPSTTPAPVWRDKLSGLWVDSATTAILTIDLDGGTMGGTVHGATLSTVSIAFDHEEGKTVFVRFTVANQNSARVDRFRFLNDDTVSWEQGDRKTLLQRKK